MNTCIIVTFGLCSLVACQEFPLASSYGPRRVPIPDEGRRGLLATCWDSHVLGELRLGHGSSTS